MTATTSARPRIEATCSRCGGSGQIPRFGWYAEGLCFRCNGAGRITLRAHRDGTVDHDHWIGYPPSEPPVCVGCGLPVPEWPPVVVAKLWANGYEVFFSPAKRLVAVGDGETRRKAQAIVRRLVLAEVPNARIKWVTA